MTLDKDKEKKRMVSGLTYTLLAIGLALLLITPVTIMLTLNDGNEPEKITYDDPDGSISGDMSMDEASRDKWELFLSTAPSIEISTEPVSPIVEDSELQRITSLPEGIVGEEEDRYSSNGDGAPSQGSWEAGDDDDQVDMALDESAKSSGASRNMEESDIVKTVDNRLYILNTYLGLVVVDLEDPADPYIEGRVRLSGRPVSMYIVDFLGFVIVSDVPSEEGENNWNSGRLYIIDLTHPDDARVVMSIDLEGYPIDSRRVGEVIYIISNVQPDHYYYREGEIMIDAVVESSEGQKAQPDSRSASTEEGSNGNENPYSTHIVSIGFYNPEELGVVDTLEIDGNSGKIHASQYAIFIPQNDGDRESPKTDFTYVDISDPKGDITVRGEIEVDGYLRDRFQMDHYKGMFRVVTQEMPQWEKEDRFPSSTLRVIDARDPDDMKEISSLLIDDEGNLMATRFAGERAYTIHLPESIDPLDVIDLSDPADPRLTDVLEIPGWVEHLEVIGEKIIAIGVDTEEERKVALYLFDVTDPENAVQSDRVVIGEGYTYSQANWDEKALTVLREEGLVSLPYTSYGQNGYRGQTNGLQLISFDLEAGDLKVKGNIEGIGQISRSRIVNGNLVATSENLLQSIDISDPDEPVVEGILELAVDVRDVFIAEGKLVSVVMPPWGASGARIEVSEISTPFVDLLDIGPDGLDFESVNRIGNNVYIKGVRQGEGQEDSLVEVHRYDMSSPLDPVHYQVAQIEVPGVTKDKYEYDKPREAGMDTDEATSGEQMEKYIYYDPTSMTILNEGEIIVYYTSGYNYIYRDYGGTAEENRLAIIDWTGVEDVRLRWASMPSDLYISGVFEGEEGSILVETYTYPDGNSLLKMEFDDEIYNISANYTLKGDILGVSANGTFVYTSLHYWMEGERNSTLNIYDISGIEARFIEGISIGEHGGFSAMFQDDRIVLVEIDHGYYYGGYGGYLLDDIAYDEVEKGSTEDSYDDDDMDDTEDSVGSEDPDNLRDGDLEDPGEIVDEPVPETNVHIINLVDGLFASDTTITLEGSYYSQRVLDDLMIMQSGSMFTALELDGDHGTVKWWSPGWISGGDVDGDLMVLAIGMYGVETIDL